MKRNLKIYIILTAILIFGIGCAIDSIKGAITNVMTNGFHPPIWDVDLKVNLLEKKFSISEILENQNMLGSVMNNLGDVSFDKVTAADISDGGKFYYPDANNFGLREGDYVLSYHIPFPGMENFIGSGDSSGDNQSINASMIKQFTDNFVYELDNLPTWPFLMGFSVDIAELPEGYTQTITHVDLSKLNIDINGDGTNDILLKGVYSKNASLQLTLRIIKTNKSTGETEKLIPTPEEISIDYITIENTKYFFDTGKMVGDGSGENDGLICSATGFITAEDGSHIMWFNGSHKDDNTDDFSELNIDEFKFTFKAQPLDKVDLTPGYSYKLVVNAHIDFGDDYNLICDIKKMNFDLQTTSLDTSMFSMLETGNEKKDLGSYFTSNISFANAGIYFTAKSTLPLPINLTSLFDNSLGGITVNLPDAPVVDQTGDNGAIITYFDTNGDNSADTYQLLSFTEPTEILIPGYNDQSTDITPIKFALYGDGEGRGNSNLGKVLEYNDEVNSVIRRPHNMFFSSYFSIPEQINYPIGVRNMDGGISIEAGLVIPISFMILGDKPAQDLLGAIGQSGIFSTVLGSLSSISMVDVKDLVITMTIDNGLPLGLTIDMEVYADMSDDTTIYFSMVRNKNSLMTINHGELKRMKGDGGKETDDYYIASSKKTTADIGIVSNFEYKKRKTSTGEDILDAQGNPVTTKFNGTFMQFVQEHSNVQLAFKVGLLESQKKDGNYIATRITSSDYLGIKASLKGTTTLNFAGGMPSIGPVDNGNGSSSDPTGD